MQPYNTSTSDQKYFHTLIQSSLINRDLPYKLSLSSRLLKQAATGKKKKSKTTKPEDSESDF